MPSAAPSSAITPPTGTIVSCSALAACSVITVFGREVPAGSFPTSWMTGLRMHDPAGHPGGDSAMKLPLTSARPPVAGSPRAR